MELVTRKPGQPFRPIIMCILHCFLNSFDAIGFNVMSDSSVISDAAIGLNAAIKADRCHQRRCDRSVDCAPAFSTT
eukprot:6475604-Amphidinium_carterae.1